jgi:uncharacterized protein (DUF58 family)
MSASRKFDLSVLRQFFGVRDLRNAAVVGLTIIGGIGLAVLTIYAHETQQARLAGIAAALSLIFVLLILIFVVPPLAKNAGKEASQMNLPFEFTVGGAIVLGLMLIVGFSAWNTGNNLLFLVLSLLAAALAVSFLAGSICLKKLDVRMRFPETIFAGERTPILVSLDNRKRFFASYSVVAEVRGTDREKSAAAAELGAVLPGFIAERLAKPPLVRRTLSYFVRVPRRSSSDSKSEHIFQRRGRFVIKDFELSTGFPFGFFRHRRRLAAKEAELFVFPAAAALPPETEAEMLSAGVFAVNKRGQGQDLLTLRDYQPADDLRHIDWKATARSRDLIVREHAAEDDTRVTIVFDTRIPAEEDSLTVREKLRAEHNGESVVVSERFEKAVALIAAFIQYFTEEQAEIRLIVGGVKGEAGIGKAHLYSLLRELAVVEPVFADEIDGKMTSDVIEDLIEYPPISHIFVFSACEGDKLSREAADMINFVRI